MTINTSKVTGRRTLRYETFDDLLDDVDKLASGSVRTLGNWSFGQILEHISTTMEASIDGFGARAPWWARMIFGRIQKRRFLTRTMSPGFNLPKRMSRLLPAETSVADGVEHLAQAVERLRNETQRSPHPLFENLTREESDQLQLRHAELHLSFVVPV